MLAVPTIHPAAILRGASDGDEKGGVAKYEHIILGDLRRALDLRHRKPLWDESSILRRVQDADGQWRYAALFPRSVQEVADFCRHAKGRLLADDVETTDKTPFDCELICDGLTAWDGTALCVPFMVGGGDRHSRYWTPGDEVRVRALLRDLHGDRHTPHAFHNFAFDTTIHLMEDMPVARVEHCTMQCHHVFDGEMRAGLDFVASRRFDNHPGLEIPYWKGEAKGDKRGLELDPFTFRLYNLRDSGATHRLVPILLDELDRLRLRDLYRREMALAHVMRRAMWRGLEVDLVRRDSIELVTEEMLADSRRCARLGISPRDLGQAVGLGPRMQAVRAKALAELIGMAGDDRFNPSSHDQLNWLLYDQLKFPVVARSKKTNKPSTDKSALAMLVAFADTAQQKAGISAVVRFRKAVKALGTWIDGLPIMSDYRFHPSWKLLTASGRFASTPNAQNWNAAVKRIFCAERLRDDAGNLVRDSNGDYVFTHRYVSVDLNQAELRAIGYYANDDEFLRMYREGVNVHTANTTMLFGIRCPPEANVDGQQCNAATERYLRERCQEALGVEYDDVPTFAGDKQSVKERWKTTRTLNKNEVFGSNYGATDDTLYDTLRSKRDPVTDELLFPDIMLRDVQAFGVKYRGLHPAIPRWWKLIENFIRERGYYRSPVSDRIRWFRGGIKRNEALNQPIQEFVAWIMERMVEVDVKIQQLAGSDAAINMQVHDMINVECLEKYVPEVGEILTEVFSRPFDFLPPPPFTEHRGAVLPADPPTVGKYLDQV